MTGEISPALLLGAACLLLCGLGLSGATLLRGIERRNRAEARIAGVVKPLTRERPLKLVGIGRISQRESRGCIGWAAWVFGYTPERSEIYRLAWWIVLPVTGSIALIASSVAKGLLGPVAQASFPVIWIMLSRGFFGRSETRIRRQLLVQLPDALAMIVRALRVGIPVADAVRLVAREAQPPTAGEFARLHDRILIGEPIEQGLHAMARRTGLDEYRFFATAVSLQSQTGGGLTEVMENLADVIRRRVALQSRGLALSSEARSSAIVLSILPMVTGMLIWFIDPSYMDTLFHEHVGRILLGIAMFSLAIGIVSMRGIIRRTLA
ncbi:MAG: type II secretion system F family protein [Acetobacteraceae bacterium]